VPLGWRKADHSSWHEHVAVDGGWEIVEGEVIATSKLPAGISGLDSVRTLSSCAWDRSVSGGLREKRGGERHVEAIEDTEEEDAD
jgi:hypothetical protein